METDNCGHAVDCGTCIGGGCFVGGTRVRMADGSDKPIELVEPGDRVLGRGGKINRVRSILYPMLGDRPLYSLNGGTAFVTASHPFLTTDGWKAIDPDAAREEVPGLDIERLTVGDVLLSVTSSEQVQRRAELNTKEHATDLHVHCTCKSRGSHCRAWMVAPQTQQPSCTTSTSMETTPTWQTAWSSTISIVRRLRPVTGLADAAFPSHWFTGEGDAASLFAETSGKFGVR